MDFVNFLSLYFFNISLFQNYSFGYLFTRFLVLGLEINERPSKKTLLDFEKLAISGSTPQKG